MNEQVRIIKPVGALRPGNVHDVVKREGKNITIAVGKRRYIITSEYCETVETAKEKKTKTASASPVVDDVEVVNDPKSSNPLKGY